jgi:hypothetical protein
MTAISITAEAYVAINATLPMMDAASSGPDGLISIWLDRAVVDRLRALRGPGESYSDVILRVAKEGGRRGIVASFTTLRLVGAFPRPSGGRRGPMRNSGATFPCVRAEAGVGGVHFGRRCK